MDTKLKEDNYAQPYEEFRNSLTSSNDQKNNHGNLQYEDAEQDNEMYKYLGFAMKVALPLGLIAYTIAAIVTDFEGAKDVLWIELFFGSILLLKFLYEWKEDQCDSGFASLEASALRIWESKVVRIVVYGLFVGFVVGIVIYLNRNSLEKLRSALGLFVLVGLSYVFSWKRKQVIWRPVLWGFALQFIFALFILRTDPGFSAFQWLGDQVTRLLDYTKAGSGFVFGYLINFMIVPNAVGTEENPNFVLPPVFAFNVLPTVIFFSALVSMLYYFGILQFIIKIIGGAMSYVLGTSASESLNAAGNIFVGQTEAPLLIRPFLKDMTKSELHAVMTGGFATVAGGVLAIYIENGVDAASLLAASVMSAPAALAISKLIYPETEDSPSASGKTYNIPKGDETNVIEAASNGAAVAVGLALNIGGMLIAFLAIVDMLDTWVNFFGVRVGWDEASFTALCGYLFWPIAYIMGVDADECLKVGELIGFKIIVNEFLAYDKLAVLIKSKGLSQRAITIATYACCGFSNFGSIGIQLGGLGPLAPERKGDMATVVFSAMVAGNIACFMTACIAGLLSDE